MTYIASDKEPPYDDVDVINIPFPKKKTKALMKLCGLDHVKRKDLQDNQISQIFVNATYKWLTGEWSLDELASIGSMFWSEKKDKFDELGTALYAASESAYYIRRIYYPSRKEKEDSFSRWIEDIMKYYETHRDQVVKI